LWLGAQASEASTIAAGSKVIQTVLRGSKISTQRKLQPPPPPPKEEPEKKGPGAMYGLPIPADGEPHPPPKKEDTGAMYGAPIPADEEPHPLPKKGEETGAMYNAPLLEESQPTTVVAVPETATEDTVPGTTMEETVVAVPETATEDTVPGTTMEETVVAVPETATGELVSEQNFPSSTEQEQKFELSMVEAYSGPEPTAYDGNKYIPDIPASSLNAIVDCAASCTADCGMFSPNGEFFSGILNVDFSCANKCMGETYDCTSIKLCVVEC